MSQITKATPRAILEGIDDKSTRALPVEPEQIPSHLPYLYLFTERGPTMPQLVSGDSMLRTYGNRSFDFLGPYANHQTVFAQRFSANANAVFIQRLKPADAKTAMMRLSLEIVKDEVTVYERNDDGSTKYDQAGDPVPDTTVGNSGVVVGYRTRWHLQSITEAEFGVGTIAPPEIGEGMTSSIEASGGDWATSEIIPIQDFMVASHGQYGNRIGLRLSAHHEASRNPGDVNTMRALKSWLYRYQMVERPVDRSTPNIVRSQYGETSVDLGFERDLVHPTLGTQLSVEDVLIDRYERKGVPGYPDVDGPFGDTHLYYDNIVRVSTKLALGRLSLNPTGVAAFRTAYDADNTIDVDTWWDALDTADQAEYGEVDPTWTSDPQTTNHALGERYFDGADHANRDPDDAFDNPLNAMMFNVVSGVDFDGAPYYNAVVEGAGSGGVTLSAKTTQYALGGADGDISLENYDALVRNQVSNFGDLDAPLLDDAMYPMSIFYDSGFSTATKKAMLTPIGRRKDLAVILATQPLYDYADPEDTTTWGPVAPYDAAEENAAASVLKTAAELYPESEIYGTSVCRVAIVGHCGKLLNHPYKGTLPLTLDVADKLARYMGAGDGNWQPGFAPDVAPANQVSMFNPDSVNITFKQDLVYDEGWSSGLIWVQNFDRQRLYFPAFQTVYDNDTSVLNSLITMLACVELEKVAQRTFRELVGNTTLTTGQFIERSDDLIDEKTRGRFDGRFIIEPETFLTQNDELRGYSWSTKIKIFANNMRTVGTMTIEAYRMEDAEQ